MFLVQKSNVYKFDKNFIKLSNLSIMKLLNKFEDFSPCMGLTDIIVENALHIIVQLEFYFAHCFPTLIGCKFNIVSEK